MSFASEWDCLSVLAVGEGSFSNVSFVRAVFLYVPTDAIRYYCNNCAG